MMKKWLLVGTSVLMLLILVLVGHGVSNGQAGLGSEPPMLTVRCGENSVKAWRGTYSWSYEEDGKGVGISADSVHPLEAKDSMSPLVVATDDASAVVHLEFEAVPDTVIVRAWDTALWNRNDADAQAVDVVVNAEQTLALLPFDAVYEVTAIWTQENGCGGTAFYGFYTEGKDNV